MFENFPYTDMHQLNLDWIVKIAKDFLEQYTHIQDLIEQGQTDIQNLTAEELQALTDKKNELEALLDQWYNTHSNDIALELANAIGSFNSAAEEKARVTIASIPDDYSVFYSQAVKAHRWGFTLATDYSAYPEYMDLNAPVTPNEVLGYGELVLSQGVPGYPDKFKRGFTLINLCARPNDMSGGMQIAVDWLTGEIATRASTGNPSALTWTKWNYSGNDVTSYIPIENGTANTVINESGSIISNQYTTNYILTDYIPVSIGDIVSIGYVRGVSNLPGGVVFDENYNVLFPLGFDKDYDGAFTIRITDYRAAYIRVNIVPNQFISLYNNYIFVEKTNFPVDITDLYIRKTINYTEINNNWFQNILDCANYIIENNLNNVNVHVLYGSYDIINEFGASFFASYDGNDRYAGVKFGNNCTWLFSDGAKITCNYSGSNIQVANNFSPIVIIGSCHIEDMELVVTNCQYCVHDDYNIRNPDVHITYKNCLMKHNGNTIGNPGLSCIGGGTLPYEVINIEGGYFNSAYNYPISYHSLYSPIEGNFPSKIVIKDAFVTGGISFNDAPYNNNTVDVTITSCSFGIPIGGTHTRFTIREWNNIIR